MTDNNVKNQIISSARLHFSKYGFHKTTMDEIARHLHKAKGVLYYYFKSKEDLFKEVLKQELDEVKTELNEITMGQDDSLNILKKSTCSMKALAILALLVAACFLLCI